MTWQERHAIFALATGIKGYFHWQPNLHKEHNYPKLKRTSVSPPDSLSTAGNVRTSPDGELLGYQPVHILLR
jgi:hypothetical protein